MTAERPRVLLVDDDATIREHLTGVLERSGLDVEPAADGAQALRSIEASTPDLVILDVMMPVMDGREALRRIRAGHDWLPVILLTQVGESFERAAALDEGADDYLNKPFDPHELIARIRAVLRRTRQDGPPLANAPVLISTFGLKLDRVGRRAWINDRNLVITPKGFTLLEYLMVHQDELIERTRLLEVLWGFDDAVGTRAVDSRVAELRRVLGEDAANPRWIATVQGRGYRFVAEVRGANDLGGR